MDQRENIGLGCYVFNLDKFAPSSKAGLIGSVAEAKH